IFQSVVGLKVTFNGGDVVQVTVPQGTTGKVCGLCGNYNGQSPDDHELGPTCPDQRGLLTDNEDLFGRSWTLREEQSDVCNVDCGDTKPPVDKCNLPMALIQKECDKLMNLNTSPFKVRVRFSQMLSYSAAMQLDPNMGKASLGNPVGKSG
uniref:VWFD domain-containing protein n=1 Tax=Biomphalaria glabrata TaxID=6526 RepID=A0A2C9KSN6_BIOGL